MKKITGVIIVIIVLCLLFIAGCKNTEVREDNKPTIAIVLKTLNNPFFIDIQSGAEEAAKKYDINLVVQAAEREIDVEKQMQIIENLIQRKVDVICLAAAGSKEIIPAIVKANRAGIYVIAIDTRVDEELLNQSGGKITAFIGSDNFEGGRIAGEFIAEKLNGSGNIAILEGVPGHETGDARLNGFHTAIDKFQNINIIASQTANFERDQGFNVFQNILQANPGVEAVFACNDMMGLGAIEAISAAGKTGDIIVLGFDAIEDSRRAILDGVMTGSIAQYPKEMGRAAIEFSMKAINGESIPKEIPINIELITKDKLKNK